MKINMPVTDREVSLSETSSIVSKTDLKGRITYINREFIEISGFLESELIGKSHNIVRHPDMPPEAFADLWNTVKAGNPWNGIVKNRCKNGDYYWVEANVAPIREAGKVIGFMSVRSKPSNKQIESAEALYKAMREGNRVRKSPSETLLNKIISLPLIYKVSAAVILPFLATLLSFVMHDYLGTTLVSSVIVGGIATVIAVISLNKFIVSALTDAANAIKAISEGDFKSAINCHTDDEIGKVMKLIKTMQIRVGFDVNDARKAQEEASKLQVAIGNSSTAFSFSDNHNRIIYMNSATKDIWEKMSSRVKAKFPDFEAEAMLGLPAGHFFEDGADKKMFASPFKEPKNIELTMYGLDLTMSIVPVYNDSHEYLGYMTQWQDITLELIAEKEVIRLVDEAIAGNLSQRVETGILSEGFVKKIGVGINQILDAVIEPLNVAASYVDKISNGEIPPKITDEYKGDFNAIKNNLNQCIDAINALISDTSILSNAAVQGQLSTRADTDKHQGDFRTIVEGINSTLDAVIGPLNIAANYIDSISSGNIPEKITEEFNGDFNTIKNNLNTCVDAVNQLVADANMLAEAAQEGYISQRVDTSKHQGDYRHIVDGMNKTLDLIVGPITTVKEAIETITTAANEISTGNTHLSNRTERQAASLEETAASMEQLAATVKSNDINAQNANQLVHTASKIADEGGKVVGEVVKTMHDINMSAQKIEEIISVINAIAFQTNILALNAAVEAARAGEQGKGFAVVASEVGNLAQRSSAAAKEIEALITDSVTKTTDGTNLVETAGKTMNEIVQSVKQVTETISEITSSSKEQAAGINQVNESVTSMDDSTQQNAALVEQAAAASESLKEQAVELSDMVSMFKLNKTLGSQDKPQAKRHDTNESIALEKEIA